MKTLRILFAAAALTTLFTLMVSADTVVLKSGTTLVGTVTSMNGGNVTIATTMGITATIPSDQIASMSFGNATAAPAVAAAPAVLVVTTPPAVPAAPTAPAAPVTIPPGTALLVSLSATVSSDQKAGAMFQTTFMQNVMVGSQVAVPAGATAIGKLVESRQGGRIFGRASTELVLTSIIVNGQSYAVQTNSASAVAQSGGLQKTAVNTAAGAAIGAAAGNAGMGAAIGASSTLLRRSEGVSTPAGTVLQFVTAAPTTI
jgi:hypothetical protein